MQKLSAKTARLLSSTQVVTSVSNSVKELVENALDAEATIIDVKLEKGGLSKIEVRDNGVGIKSTDVSYAAQRHFTSKIASHNDLMSLSTYGFRGEALSALCEVADVSIITRTKDELYSTVYVLDSTGTVKSKKPSHIAQGTTVIACNLFKNIPVRKQFFSSSKKQKEQLTFTENILMSFAVALPNVQFKLINDRNVVWQKPKSTSFKSALVHVLGSFATQFIEKKVICEEQNICLKLYYSKQFLTRKSPDRCFIVANKRPIRDKELEKLLRLYLVKPTDEKQHSTGWPVVLLLIEVPMETIDVNVNANKTAVLFTLKKQIIELLTDLIHPEPDQVLCNKENHSDITNNQTLTKSNADDLNLHKEVHESTVTDQLLFDKNLFSETNDIENMSSDKQHEVVGNVLGFSPFNSNSHPSNNVIISKTSEIVTSFSNTDNLLHERNNSVCEIEISKKEQKEVSSSKNFTSNVVHSTQLDDVDVEPNFPDFTFLSPDPQVKNTNSENATVDNGLNQIEVEGWSHGNMIKDDDGKIVDSVRVFSACGETKNASKKRPNSESSFRQSTLDNVVMTPQSKKPRSVFDICRENETGRDWEKLSEKRRERVIDVASKEYDSFTKLKKKAPNVKTKNRMSFTSLSLHENEEEESVENAFELPLSFNMKKLSEKIKLSKPISLAKEMFFDIIGNLETQKSAIVRYKTDFFVVNLNRLQENVAFHNLSEQYSFSSIELDCSLKLTEESLGLEEMECLRGLKFSTKTSLQPDMEILDERITSNGFKVKCSDAMWLHSLTTDVPYYGISDLREILSKICKDNTVTLKGSRPSKIVYYLQGEAARVVRTSPMQTDKNDILNAIKLLRIDDESWKDVLCDSVCFHGKHIFHRLESIDGHNFRKTDNSNL